MMTTRVAAFSSSSASQTSVAFTPEPKHSTKTQNHAIGMSTGESAI